MRRRFLLALAALALVAVVPPAHAEPHAAERICERALAIAERMADIVVADKNDCSKLDLDRFASDTAAERAELEAQRDALDPEQRKALEKKLRARFEAAAARLMSGMTKCAADEHVQDAIARFED